MHLYLPKPVFCRIMLSCNYINYVKSFWGMSLPALHTKSLKLFAHLVL